MPPQQEHKPTPEVLIVDDEIETCELLAEFCRAHALPTATARDGRAAIDAIKRTSARFGIVITDLHMPGADGFAVLAAAKAANPDCYVVIITGFGTIDTAVRAVREGAYDYLAKPFALGQLEVIVERIRDRMFLEQQNRALLEEVHGREFGSAQQIADRLQAIEDRLARIDDYLRKTR
jgi:DNA-binding NtrC family response regulator